MAEELKDIIKRKYKEGMSGIQIFQWLHSNNMPVPWVVFKSEFNKILVEKEAK